METKKNKFAPLDRKQIDFISGNLLERPSVHRAIRVLQTRLFALGVEVWKGNLRMENELGEEFSMLWARAGTRMVHDLEAYGLSVLVFEPHERLKVVPVVFDFLNCDIGVALDDKDRVEFEVKRGGKRVTDCIVVVRYAPTKDGTLTSPLAKLIPIAEELQRDQDEAAEAKRRASVREHRIEREAARPISAAAAAAAAGMRAGPGGPIPSVGPPDINYAMALNADDAARGAQSSEDVQESVARIDRSLRKPYEVFKADDDDGTVNGDTFLVLKEGARFAPTPRVHIPSTMESELRFANGLSEFLGCPSLFWSNTSAGASASYGAKELELKQAHATIAETIREYAKFKCTQFKLLWLRAYAEEEATHDVLNSDSSDDVSNDVTFVLPSAVDAVQLQQLREFGVISEIDFRRSMADAFGWTGNIYTGPAPGPAGKQVTSRGTGGGGGGGGDAERKVGGTKRKRPSQGKDVGGDQDDDDDDDDDEDDKEDDDDDQGTRNRRPRKRARTRRKQTSQ